MPMSNNSSKTDSLFNMFLYYYVFFLPFFDMIKRMEQQGMVMTYREIFINNGYLMLKFFIINLLIVICDKIKH